ncbi:Tl [Cordylochernes scorpioides]|uniref:Tl n=1 Tax=Cordylochernes scorpioides TaxID=51811 RepID=A0ABY6LKR8_9ARAC|nr:Tl [Cordylochernes scorpioides]
MTIHPDGTRTYRACNNCPGVELTPTHIFSCPAMAAALQKFDIDPEQQLYTPKIVDIAADVMEMHGTSEALYWTRQQQRHSRKGGQARKLEKTRIKDTHPHKRFTLISEINDNIKLLIICNGIYWNFIEIGLIQKDSNPLEEQGSSYIKGNNKTDKDGGANDNFKGFFDTSRIPNYVQPNFYNVQFFTGHGDFNTYLFRIGKIGSPACTCGNGQQTPEHLLINCPLTSDLREENQLYLTNTKQAACNKDQYIKFNRFCRMYILRRKCLLAGGFNAYPIIPNPGFSCTWRRVMDPYFDRLDEICVKVNATNLSFIYELWDLPSPALKLDCRGTNPYRKDMVQNYDFVQVETFIFESCDLPELSFSEMLSNVRIRNLSFRSRDITSVNPKLFENLPLLAYIDISKTHISTLPFNLFDSITNVISVNLENNKITFLNGEIFSKLSLTYINLGFNEFETLQKKLFKSQFKLESLIIKNNKLTHLPTNIFEDLYSLKNLDLSNNKLESLAPNVFQGLGSINEILLKSNIIKEISEEWFKNATKLSNFDISKNRIVNIQENAFHGLSNMINLDMDECNLVEKLPEKLFESMYDVTLIKLSTNYIKELSNDTFKMNKNLNYLFLSYNKLIVIEDRTFMNQTALRTLDLRGNELSRISKETFKGLEQLSILNLQNNDIYYIDEQSFDELTYLKTLDLSDNSLKFLPKDIFKINLIRSLNLSKNNLISTDNIFYNFQYKNLDLSGNDLKYIEIPRSENSAIQLDVRNNKIEYVNVSKITLSTYSGKIMLQNNPIKCDCQTLHFYQYYKTNKHIFSEKEFGYLTCSNPQNLKGVNIDYVNDHDFICDIKENCPNKCKCYTREIDKITFMNCSNSYFKSLPTQAVANVSILQLDNNRISSIIDLDKPEWQNLRQVSFLNNYIISENWSLPQNLEYINLKNNKLSWLPQSILNYSLSNNKFIIKLGGNRWDCNCNLTNMKVWLDSLNNQTQDIGNIICKDLILEDGIHHEYSLDEIPFEILCPTKPIDICIIAIPICIILIIIFMIFLYYKNKQTVLSYLYTHAYRIFILISSEEETDEDKLYDAFICYSHEDRDVAVELRAGLESKSPLYTLCIHERGWKPGNMISPQVIQSVQDSRRTILILSEIFLKSPWFPQEFRRAYQTILEEIMDRLIIVVRGKVPNKFKLDPDLQFLFEAKNCLNWKERWFWEKIQYALPHKNIKIQSSSI